jgi:sugar-specific transcriptional regulator TrmB
MDHTIINSLITYGLNEKQAKVYITCLELGTATIQHISKRLGIPRSSCEVLLSQLQKKGFVSMHSYKKVRRYTAEDPKSVLEQSHRKVKTLESIIPNLSNLYLKSTPVPSVRLYEGKEGVWMVLEEILKEAKILYGFGSADALYDSIGDTFPDFRTRRIQKKIPVHIILKDTPRARQRQRLGPSELRDVRLIQDAGESRSLIFMWNNKIASFSFNNQLMVVVLESKDIYESQMALFQTTWHSLPPYRPSFTQA